MHKGSVVKLSFGGGKLKTITWETVSQVTLRNCSKEVKGEVCIYVIWEVGMICATSTHFGRRLLLVTRRLVLVKRSRCLH